MTHANHYFESKLERECPKALPYFREYLTAMNGSLYLLGVGGESAYYWALQKVKEETQNG